MLLNRGAIKLVIIDSIAALFRVEYSFGETSKRAKVLRSSGAQLHKLSHQHGIPVVCVNQVCTLKLLSPVPGDIASHAVVFKNDCMGGYWRQ